MKAIKILKKIYKNNPDTRIQRNNVDVNFTIHDFNNINKAIKELEELENRSCGNCKHWNDSCFNVSVNTTGFCRHYVISNGSFEEDMKNNFYCNKWENKA